MKKRMIAGCLAIVLLVSLLSACQYSAPSAAIATHFAQKTSTHTAFVQNLAASETTTLESEDEIMMTTETLSVGETRTVFVKSSGLLTVKPMNSAVKVSNITYKADLKGFTMDIAAEIPGSCDILLIEPTGAFRVLPIEIPMPTQPGEWVSCSQGATYSGTTVSSPAGEEIDKAFDGNVNTKWLTKSQTGSLTVTFSNGVSPVVKAYGITSANDDWERDPKSWTLYGSVDGKEWVALDTRTNQTFASRLTENRYEFDNTEGYQQYRLDITANSGLPYLQLAELTLYEIADDSLPDYSNLKPVSAATLTVTAPKTVLFEKESMELIVNSTASLTAVSTDANLSITYVKTEEGKTLIGVEALGSVTKGRIIVLDGKGGFGSYTVSAVGEGSYTYITDTVQAETSATSHGVTVDDKAAFDGNRTTILSVDSRELTLTVFFGKDNPILVNSYALVCGNQHGNDPTTWRFEASNDGTSWTLLDSRTQERFEGDFLRRIFDSKNTAAYCYYRIRMSSAESADGMELAEFQLIQSGAYPSSWALGPFEKLDAMNPILVPNSDDAFLDPILNKPVYWSEEALYNPTAVVKDDVVCLLYRSQDHPLISRVGLALSLDGTHFENYTDPVLYPDDEDEYYQYEIGGGCEDPRVIKGEDGIYYMYYTAYDRQTGIARLFVASSPDLKTWTKHGNAIGDAYRGKYANYWAKSASVICDMVGDEFIARRMDDGKYWFYFGEGKLFAAYSDDLIHWTPLEDENGDLLVVMEGREGKFDARLVECGPQAIYTEYGIFLIYNGANADPNGTGDPMMIYNAYSPGMVMFDPHNWTEIVHRSETFFMYPEKDYELDGLVNNVCFVEGLVYYHGSWYLYYGTADSRLAVAVYTPDVRHDGALLEAIAKAETVKAPDEALTSALRMAKEAAASALYKQEWVDEITAQLQALLP